MKKLDVFNLSNLLNQSENISKITDIDIAYPLFELNKELENKVQGYAEFVKKQKDPKKAEQELIMQDEKDIDIKKYKKIEKLIFKDKKLNLSIFELKVFDKFFH